MVTSWSISFQIAQTTPHFWISFQAKANRNGPNLFLKLFLSILSISIVLITISLPDTNTYWLWYTLLGMFSWSAVIQGIISYLTSKNKTLDVMLILSEVKLFISHVFDVRKEKITSPTALVHCTAMFSCSAVIKGIISYLTSKNKTLHVMLIFIWRQIVNFSLIWR